MQEKYGEAFRYFLLREPVFGLDSDFSEAALVRRLNADLANDLGNLVSRVTTMIVNFGGGQVPKPNDQFGDEERALESRSLRVVREVDKAMEEFAFQRALSEVWLFLGVVNRYVDLTEPWALAKRSEARSRLDTVLYTLGESLRFLGIVLDAFLPDTARKIRTGIGQTVEPKLAHAKWGGLKPGTSVQKVSALFPRIEVSVSDEVKLSESVKADLSSPKIPIDDFMKVELRVAEVLAAERVPKSKKLLKLTVKVGDETRTVVAGIAEQYEPEPLVGRKVVIVANLQPATLMGVESNGMVLAASHEGTVSLLTLDKDVPPGSKVT
jgi:methionyl-tRNA synthetase